MTKKPYPNAPRESRSSGTRRPRRPGLEIHAPLANHFALLDPGDDDHPVDLMVDRVPTIARRAKHLRRLAEQVRHHLGDDSLFLRHEDERLEQQTEREETYYNFGFEQGHLAARASASDSFLSPDVKVFVGKLQNLLMTTAVPDFSAAVVLLNYAGALLFPLEHSPSGTRGRARQNGKRSRHRQP